MPSIKGIKETCLTVADLERSERFYGDLFDLQVIGGDARFRALDVAGAHVLLLFLAGGSEQAVELPGGTIPSHGASGRSHLAFAISTADIDVRKAHLTSHGLTIESTVTWPLGGASIYFRDPGRASPRDSSPRSIWSILLSASSPLAPARSCFAPARFCERLYSPMETTPKIVAVAGSLSALDPSTRNSSLSPSRPHARPGRM